MRKWEKLKIIRGALDQELHVLTYVERDKAVREWAEHPLALFEESVAAGYLYADEGNPVLNGAGPAQDN